MTAGGMTFNGIDTGAAPYGLILEHRHVALIPKTRDRAVMIPGRPGSHDFGTELGERSILIDGYISQTTNANLEAAVPAIASLFDPTNEAGSDRGYKQLIFDTQPDRYYLAKLTGEPQVDRNATTATLTLQLRCADPFAYALAATVATGAVAVIGGLDVGLIDVGLLDIAPSVSLTVTTGGTYRTDAVIDVTMAGGYTGPLIVVSLTTGQWVSWNGTLAPSDAFTVDGTTQRAYVNGVLSMSGVVSGSRWPQLLAAQSNLIQVLGPSPTLITSISVTYRNRWI